MNRETLKKINYCLNATLMQDTGKSTRTLLHETSGAIVDIALALDDARSDQAAIRAIVLLIRWIEQED